MKYLNNEKGIILVLVLLIAFMGLAMVAASLYMATLGTQMSGYTKQYRTVEEASYGGTQIFTEYMNNMGTFNLPTITAGIYQFPAGCNCENGGTPKDLNAGNAETCRCDKMCLPTAQWNLNLCGENPHVSLDPTVVSDLQANFPSTANSQWTVFAKVVDTVQGNTDTSGIVKSGQLESGGVVDSNSGVSSPAANPYIYRMEVRAEATNNPTNLSNFSVIYAH
jgi:hypothetical protein